MYKLHPSTIALGLFLYAIYFVLVPDCGHVYDKSSSTKAGGKYTVSATSDWVVTWEGAGQTGTIRLNGLTRTVAIAVGEAQVLVQ